MGRKWREAGAAALAIAAADESTFCTEALHVGHVAWRASHWDMQSWWKRWEQGSCSAASNCINWSWQTKHVGSSSISVIVLPASNYENIKKQRICDVNKSGEGCEGEIKVAKGARAK
jgi:hypothetical protein